MTTTLNYPSGTGFFGRGYWGRKVFWLNVPSQWRNLDQYNYLQMLLNTWGDVGENLIEYIKLLPKQRDPYEVRTLNTIVKWFYVTEAFNYYDKDKGNIIRLIGEKDPDRLPGANLLAEQNYTEYLFGETIDATYQHNANRIFIRQFYSSNDSLVSKIIVYSLLSGNVKVMVYDDNAGTPGKLLSSNDSSVAVIGGQWNLISVPKFNVLSDTYYWIGAITDTDQAIGRHSSTGGVTEYLDALYSDWSAPNIWPGGSSITYQSCFSAYGAFLYTEADLISDGFDWYPYEPLSEVSRYWQLRWNDAQYEVMNVRSRNFDQENIYNSNNSLANEIWVKGGDLTLLFDYLTNRLWNKSIEDDLIQGTVEIGITDGSQRPYIELPVTPIRLENRWSSLVAPSSLIEASTLRIYIPLQGGGNRILYDYPKNDSEGTLRSESGGIITGTVVGNVNYLSGEIDFDLSILSEFSSQTAQSIKAKYQVRGYYMKFNAPPNIDYLAHDYGFNNDENDPEDVQRSSIANVTKFWGIKSTQDSYRIRGEISLFDVYMQGLYKICSAELASKLPSDSVYEVGTTFYTDVMPTFIRYDHISVDELFYDYNSGGSPIWVTIIDNMLIALDSSRWDGMTIGQAYAVDVTQGYYAPISEVNAVLRGPATVQSVTQISQEELEERRWENGYRYEIEMRRCQYEAFNMILDSNGIQTKELFALSVYDYNPVGPEYGVPPNVNDVYYYIDREDIIWTLTSSPSSDPKEDIGVWTVDVRFGVGVSSPIQVTDDVAVRYLPLFDDMDCCYCRASSMRAYIDVIEEAYNFYDTYKKIEYAITRLKMKLSDLLPIHTRIIEWEITRRFQEEFYGVQNGSTVVHTLTGEQFLNNTKILLSVKYRGDSDSGTPNTDLDFRVYSEDTGTVWELLNWNPVTPAGDNETWVDVVTDEEIILPDDPSDPGPPIVPYYASVRAIAGSASLYGDVMWIFKITTKE
jgi:hypothetical protein